MNEDDEEDEALEIRDNNGAVLNNGDTILILRI